MAIQFVSGVLVMTVYLNMNAKACLIYELSDSYKLFNEQENSSLWKSLVEKSVWKTNKQ